MNDLIERYIGHTVVSEFDTIEEIEEYFELSNLIYMFGEGEYVDREEALQAVVRAWLKDLK